MAFDGIDNGTIQVVVCTEEKPPILMLVYKS